MTEPIKPRANYSIEFKLAMVEKYLQPGVSGALLARNNGINDNLLFKLRRRYRHLSDAPVDKGAGTPVIIEDNIVPVLVGEHACVAAACFSSFGNTTKARSAL